MPLQRNTEEWQALLTYRNSLVQGEHEIHPITLKQAAQKRYGKRKQAGHAEGRCFFLSGLVFHHFYKEEQLL